VNTEDEQDEKATNPAPEPPARPTLFGSLTSLIFTTYSSGTLNLLNALINTILFAMTLELALGPVFDPAHDVTFTRIGAVYPDAAKITVRYPGPLNDTHHEVLLVWREAGTSDNLIDWKDGPILTLSQESDWTNTTKLTGLWPSTSYECMFSLSLI
jgi:alkaline phosphatase D